MTMNFNIPARRRRVQCALLQHNRSRQITLAVGLHLERLRI